MWIWFSKNIFNLNINLNTSIKKKFPNKSNKEVILFQINFPQTLFRIKNIYSVDESNFLVLVSGELNFLYKL